MDRILMAVFARRDAARSALRDLESRHDELRLGSARIHEGSVDILLGMDVSGTPVQSASEGDLVRRFGIVFALSALVGFGVDISGAFGDTGLSATMALGCLGILLGTLLVLTGVAGPFDRALAEAEETMREGGVLLTVPVTGPESVAAASIARHGGRVLATQPAPAVHPRHEATNAL